MSDPIRILLIDDHPLFRKGVVQTLSTEPGFQIVGQGENGADAYRLACELLPDIILLDIGIPGGGIQTARDIALVCPAVKIVMLTVSEDEDNLSNALRAGARAYILKGVSAQELIRILSAVSAGEVYVSPGLADSLLRETRGASGEAIDLTGILVHLTIREREILEQVATGASNKEIADRFFLSEKTVKHYMTNILQKLQVRNRVEAALLAQRAWIEKTDR